MLAVSKQITNYSLGLVLGLMCVANTWAKTTRVGPDDNLTMVSTAAKSGDVLILGAHDYQGQIVVRGISLEVRGAKKGGTSLSSPTGDALIHLSANGKLTLSHAELRVSNKDQVALYNKGGQATVRHTKVTGGRGKHFFYVERGQLNVEDCQFANITSQAILATDQARVSVLRSHFKGVKQRAIVVQKSSRATIQDSEFEQVHDFAVYVSEQSNVQIKKSRFGLIEGTAVQIEQGSSAELTAVRFENISNHAVVLLGKSTAQIDSSVFQDISQIGVVVKQSPSFAITKSKFFNVGQALNASEQIGKATFSQNQIYGSTKKIAVALLETDQIAVNNNTIVNSAGTALHIEYARAAGSSVNNNRFIRSGSQAVYIANQGSTTEPLAMEFNQIIFTGTPALLIDQRARVQFSNNLVLTDAANGLYVQNEAAGQFKSNVIHAHQKSVYYHSSGALDSQFSGGNVMTRGYFNTPRHQEIHKDGAVASSLMQDSGQRMTLMDRIDAALKQAQRTATPSDLEQLDARVASLNELISRYTQNASGLARIRVRALGAGGNEFIPEYLVIDLSGSVVSRNSAADPIAAVKPGSYRVRLEQGDPTIYQALAESGQTVEVKIPLKNYWVFTMVDSDKSFGWRTTEMALKLKSAQDLEGGLGLQQEAGYAHRRLTANESTLNDALVKARQYLTGLRTEYRGVTDRHRRLRETLKPTDSKVLDAQRDSERVEALLQVGFNILAIAGQAKDAQDLVALARADEFLRYQHLELAAHIEKRLGILSKGAVYGALDDKQETVRVFAASRLYRLGLESGKAVLLSHLRLPADRPETPVAVYALGRRPDPAVQQAMAKVVEVFAKERQRIDAFKSAGTPATYPIKLWNAAVHASIYLIAYGDEQQKRLATQVVYKTSHFKELVAVVDDPRNLADYYLGFRGPRKPVYEPDGMVDLCERLGTSAQDPRLHNHFESLLVKAAALNRISKKSPVEDAEQARAEYNVAVSACRPNSVTAEMIARSDQRYLNAAPWISKPWAFEKSFGNFKRGEASSYLELEQADHDVLANSVELAKGSAPLAYADLYIAYHRVGSRLCRSDFCPFVLRRQPESAGVLMGLVRQHSSEIKKGQITVALDFDIAAYPNELLESLMPKTSERHRGFTRPDGARLVEEIFLKRGDTIIPLKRVRQSKTLRYQGNTPKEGMADTYLYIRLKLDQATTLVSMPIFLESL